MGENIENWELKLVWVFEERAKFEKNWEEFCYDIAGVNGYFAV